MTKMNGEITARDQKAQAINDELYDLYTKLLPKLGSNWHRHSPIGLKVEALARTLYYSNLYEKILEVPGVICEFGVQWGATLVELINLRSIHEPFNHSRHIVGFDTFEGFPSVDSKDGKLCEEGDYSSTMNYKSDLEKILQLHESAAPLPHIKKHQLVEGDVCSTLDVWLQDNPHAVISMAILDMDLYAPTLHVLQNIVPRLTKGSLLVFDELNCKHFPGETLALQETLGTSNIRLRRTPSQPFCAWAIWGE